MTDEGGCAGVTRWRRYGKDRLYVTAADGIRLGWRDLVTGADTVELPERAAEFEAAVRGWLGAQPAASPPEPLDVPAVLPTNEPLDVPAVPPTHEPLDARPLPDIEWAVTVESLTEDLARREAGAMAREQAVAHREAAPVRTLLARALGVHTDERAWRIGADGEEKVAIRLEKLARKDPRWRFLHAVPVGANGADIDHLVVGPGGVFTLNAKHHPGAKVWVGGDTVLVNGHRQQYVRNSRHEAARAGRLLSAACGFRVTATGVVVPVGADDVTVKSAPADVHVVSRMALPRWLRARPEALDETTVATIFGAARRSTTWAG